MLSILDDFIAKKELSITWMQSTELETAKIGVFDDTWVTRYGLWNYYKTK